MKYIKLIALLFAIVFATACKDQKAETEGQVESSENYDANEETTAAKISIAPLSESPAYADAKLMLATSDEMKVPAGEADFNFQVENYELGAQTESPNAETLANSDKGQHIHFILNNMPYSAHYEPNIKKEVPSGVHHLVAFLSRSYHESVKNDNSVVVRKLLVGNDPEDTIGLDMNAPTLIYSRPKGTYVGDDAKEILLDFFVLNTELSENGNKVMATINGEEFTISSWEPYVISGLPMGDVTINLELVDANGKVIPGPFNTVERVVQLKSE